MQNHKILRKYPKEMHWNVPFLLNNDRVARDLLNTYKILFNVRMFDSIYGGFKCPWSGGRGSIREDIYNLGYVPGVDYFDSQGITPWFTFSRFNMAPSVLDDEQMWKIIESLNSYRWGAIVSSDLLLHRLKQFNPNILVKASVVKFTHEFLKNPSMSTEEELLLYLEALDKGYNFVVPRPEFILSSAHLIPSNLRDRVEILVNQFCTSNCKMASYHYNLIEKYEETGIWEGFECSSRSSYLECINNCVIDYETIVNLNEMGYSHFKLQGRGLSPRCAIDQVAKYICEPTGVIHILGEQIIQNIEREKAQGIINRF